MATTFDDAATAVWPNTPVAPTFITQPQNTTNYAGSTMSLSSLVTGQSLCALIYQWQEADTSNPGTYTNVPGANSNVFTVVSPPFGTNQYRETVTNPNSSLSVTSSPVWFVIQVLQVPPADLRPAAGPRLRLLRPVGEPLGLRQRHAAHHVSMVLQWPTN